MSAVLDINDRTRGQNRGTYLLPCLEENVKLLETVGGALGWGQVRVAPAFTKYRCQLEW